MAFFSLPLFPGLYVSTDAEENSSEINRCGEVIGWCSHPWRRYSFLESITSRSHNGVELSNLSVLIERKNACMFRKGIAWRWAHLKCIDTHLTQQPRESAASHLSVARHALSSTSFVLVELLATLFCLIERCISSPPLRPFHTIHASLMYVTWLVHKWEQTRHLVAWWVSLICPTLKN